MGKMAFNRFVTFASTLGAGALGAWFIKSATPAMAGAGIETLAIGFVAGAIMGFLIFATALEI